MEQRRYRIEIRGRLPARLADDLPDMVVDVEGGMTLLTGPVSDGPALYGLIARLEALGVELLAVFAQRGPDLDHGLRCAPAPDRDDAADADPSTPEPNPDPPGGDTT